MTDLSDQFGGIDIYLFDQLLRKRITKGMRILDAGCGFGRNLVYLLREGFEVSERIRILALSRRRVTSPHR
jgi:tellurite methyltransferase